MDQAWSKVKVGFAPTRRVIFSRPEAVRFRKLTEEKLQQLGVDYVGLAGLNEDELLYDLHDVPPAAQRFREAGVQALFLPHCNFGTEIAVTRLAKELNLPVLLWGPRDDAPLPDGERLRDTQCGLFATGKDLRRAGVPFSYLVNCRLEDPVFERGLGNFLAAAHVVHAFRNLRIGQIGTRPPAFASVTASEAELMSNFGIEIVPLEVGWLTTWARRRAAQPDEGVQQAVEQLRTRFPAPPGFDSEYLVTLAALWVSVRDWAQGEGVTAVALQCWDYLQEALGVASCFLMGVMADEGLPVACETDLCGAVSSVLLSAATLGQTPPFFADLTIRHPDNDNSELLWHCGPFPPSLAAPEEQPQLVEHYLMDPVCPAVGQFRMKDGDITLARFDGDHGEYSLMAGEGRSCPGPRVKGTYVWFEVSDWPQWEQRLVQGPYIHHVSGAYGRYAAALYEACRYLPGIQPDMFEPTAAQIEAWLRGG